MVKADFALLFVLCCVQNVGLQVDIFELLQQYWLTCRSESRISCTFSLLLEENFNSVRRPLHFSQRGLLGLSKNLIHQM